MYACNITDQLPWNKSRCGNGNVFDSSPTTESPTEPINVGRSVTIGVVCGCIAMGAIIGNILVILSVCTYRRLRTVTNCFVVSLASSDLLVAILVMPFAIKVEITGTWRLGVILCDMWVSCDVMLCTASILNLCCISLDRYFAITNPLVYATKRSKRLALIMIAVVWVAAIVITCPPILGWQEAGTVGKRRQLPPNVRSRIRHLLVAWLLLRPAPYHDLCLRENLQGRQGARKEPYDLPEELQVWERSQTLALPRHRVQL